MINLKETFKRYKDSGVFESVGKNIKSRKLDDVYNGADKLFDLEHRLIYFIEQYAYPNMPRYSTFSFGGSLVEDGKGRVDFVEVKCTHIPEEKLKDSKFLSNGMRQYIDRDIEGSLIFETTMSKSRPIRPIKKKYLYLLRYWVRSSYGDREKLGHIEVWINEWTKRFGLKSPYAKPIMFNDLDFDTQQKIYNYIVKEIEYQQSYA